MSTGQKARQTAQSIATKQKKKKEIPTMSLLLKILHEQLQQNVTQNFTFICLHTVFQKTEGNSLKVSPIPLKSFYLSLINYRFLSQARSSFE